MNDHEMNDANAGGDVFVADPADMEYYDEPELPKWPKVVGIISIVFASLGLVCGGVGTAWMFIQPGFMQSAAAQMKGGVPPQMLQHNTMLLAATFVGLAWALFLLLNGIMCVLRKPTVRPLMLVYGLGAIAITIWSMSVQMGIQSELDEWAKQNPDAEFAQQLNSGATAAGQLVGMVVGLTFSFAWPAFLLFWFGFVKTKPEQFTGGADVEVI